MADLEWKVVTGTLSDGSKEFKIIGSGDGSGHEVHITCIDEREANELQVILEMMYASHIV